MRRSAAARLVKGILKRVATQSASEVRFGRPILHAAQYTLALHHREVVNFDQPGRVRAAERIREIVTAWPTQTMGVDEAYLVRSAVEQRPQR